MENKAPIFAHLSDISTTFKKLLYRLISYILNFVYIYNVSLVNEFCLEKNIPFSKENRVLVKTRSKALTQALVSPSQWTKEGNSHKKEGVVQRKPFFLLLNEHWKPRLHGHHHWVRKTQESVSGKGVHQEAHWSFADVPAWQQRRPLKTGGEGGYRRVVNSSVGMDAYVELPALVKEQTPPMQEREVGNEEMLHCCRRKPGELDGWHMRAPMIWSRGGGREQMNARSSGCRQQAWTCLWKVMSQVMKCGTL